MTDDDAEANRYDRLALGYARWWGPVIAPAALTVLDHVEPRVRAGANRILDLGTGTGTLALDAVARWPDASVTGIDASDGMLELARAEAARLPATIRRRVRFEQATVDRLPYADGSFDVVVSSFVLQLVPNRYRALREARRVLRAGGSLTYISWLAGRDEAPFAPDTVFDEVLDEFDFDPPGDDPRSGDIPSRAAAERQLRRAGYREVRTTEGVLRHAYEPAGYLDFLEKFDEEDLFSSLEPDERDRLRARFRVRLHALPPEDLELRLPTVLAAGIRA